MAFLTNEGTPPDALGSQGDIVYDYKNGFFWGPKSATSWIGTARNVTGPTGATGNSMALGVGYGPMAVLVATPISSTPTVMNLQGQSNPAIFTPNVNGFFVGGLVYPTAGTSPVYELWDQTAQVSIYKTAALSPPQASQLGQFGPNLYKLTAGNQYVWRITGSGTFSGYVSPMYYMNGQTPFPAGNVSQVPTFQYTGSLSGTNVNMTGVNSATLNFYATPRASTFYNAVLSSASTNTGTVSFQLYNASTATVAYTAIDAVGATISLQPGQTFQTPVSGITLTATHYYVWRVSGSGSGTYNAVMNVVQ